MDEISKIKLPNSQVYQIKDEELRRMIAILLGLEEPETESDNKESQD